MKTFCGSNFWYFCIVKCLIKNEYNGIIYTGGIILTPGGHVHNISHLFSLPMNANCLYVSFMACNVPVEL